MRGLFTPGAFLECSIFMNLKKYQHILAPLLGPVGRGYGAVMSMRRKRYAAGKFKSYRPEVPVVSVGNIALGGTGKTPVTSWLLGWAAAQGKKACVLSRGYGGKPGAVPLQVTSNTPVAICGDEPLLLARNHPGAHVFVFPRRAVAAHLAENLLAPDLFVLDDGMQHLGVERDVNLVLLRPEDFEATEWGKVVPYGFWREGEDALASASAFLVKATAEQFSLFAPLAEKRLGPFGRPLFSFALHPVGCVPVLPDSGAVCLSANDLPGGLEAEYLLATGVGDPAQALRTVAGFMQRPPIRHLHFPDHHTYTEADLAGLCRGNRLVLCTEKDAVKLAPLLEKNNNEHGPGFFALRVQARFGPTLFTALSFEHWLEQSVREVL